MITLTPRAVEKFKEIAAENGESLSVRVKVMGGGCAGFSYGMDFDSNPKETDEIFDNDGISVIVDPVSHQYLDGVTVDYVDSLIGSGFKFENPNSKGSCGCGNSFNA